MLDFFLRFSLFDDTFQGASFTVDLESEILREHSKRQTVRIANWIGHDAGRFRQLVQLFVHGDYVVTQRAAWIISECFDHAPELITPSLPALLKKMQEPGVHDAVRRNIVRILQFIEIPRRLLGTVVSLCFQYLNDPETPVAIKANAMTVLVQATKLEPELRRELRTSLELLLPSMSGAICARARMVLRELEKAEKVQRS